MPIRGYGAAWREGSISIPGAEERDTLGGPFAVVVVALVVVVVVRGSSSIMKVKCGRLSLALFSVLLTCWLLGR
jgi:hypothetical protein